jgi:predicted CXXCH cytochrome family protein
LVFRLDERQGARWALDPATGNARRSPPRATAKEIEMCARCHSRRGQWFPDYTYGEPLLNAHRPALLKAGLYHADGQIDGEVYEYGSFLQSRMVAAGVTCSDCHEPHSLKLRAEGNGVCLQCHGATQYDTPEHHHHPAGGAGARCVDCHMPAKTYMEVDPRRDHSFRIPRPDLAAQLGTPDACTGCHAGKAPAWAAARVRDWLGHDPQGFQNYGETLHAARTGAADAEARLTALLRDAEAPAIARATAAAELGRRVSAESFPALAEALADGDRLVRNGALGALDGVPPAQRWQAAHGLLRDPLRVNRAQAAEALAGTPADQVNAAERAEFGRAAAEYRASLRLNGDVPATRVNEGNFLAEQGDAEGAERAYREALALDPGWVPAAVNLSDLYRQTGRDGEGETVLREGLARRPEAAALHHALGLLRVRQQNLPAALAELKRAVELAPDDARFRYVYAVALDSAGRAGEARKAVAAGRKRAPGDPGLRALDQQLRAPAR